MALPLRRTLALGTITALLLAAAPAQEGTRPGQTSPKNEVRYRARHILITWKGAAAAGPETKLTEEEARKKAEEIHAKLEDGADFASLARAESVCDSRYAGGDLGQFKKHRMYPDFEAAVAGCKVGRFVGPIETPLGFHVIQRLPVDQLWPDRIAASHILIAFEGAQRASEEVKRTRDEALILANKILGQIQKGELGFEAAAKKQSDDVTTGKRGGVLGTLPTLKLVPVFVDALLRLEPSKIGGPIETQFGFHIVRRDKLAVPLRASHILIAWKGASSAPADVTRTKAEALELAKQILERVLKGENFGGMAKLYSSCPSRLRGGDLNEFQPGQMVELFEKAVLKAKVGAIVGPVETRFGYHVIWRTQ